MTEISNPRVRKGFIGFLAVAYKAISSGLTNKNISPEAKENLKIAQRNMRTSVREINKCFSSFPPSLREHYRHNLHMAMSSAFIAAQHGNASETVKAYFRVKQAETARASRKDKPSQKSKSIDDKIKVLTSGQLVNGKPPKKLAAKIMPKFALFMKESGWEPITENAIHRRIRKIYPKHG